jgi:phosphoesterase, MJ0936 family
MRLVVFSDSHGNFDALHTIVQSHPEADGFVHLGDGEKELEELEWACKEKTFYFVHGNCDDGFATKSMELLVLEGVRIFLTHGDIFSVKYDLLHLKYEARGRKAKLVLFGHTHIPHQECDNGLYLFNPGSVSYPRVGSPTYGVVDILPEGIATSIVELKK